MARIKEYWLQLETRPWDVAPWDVAPWGIDRLSAGPPPKTTPPYRPTGQDIFVIRRYSANWAAPDDRPLNPWDLTEPDPATTGGTLPGATLTAKVADEIVVHFRNGDQRRSLPPAERVHSLHAHGVQRAQTMGGAFPLAPPDPAQGGRRGDRVMPGESFTYRWSCPQRSAAGVWLYHDGGPHGAPATAAGAFGALVIMAPGEQEADAPAGPLRRAGDSSTHFAAVPAPPKRADHLLVFHELPGVGLCLNGRAGLGNTPALVAGEGTRLTLRCLNVTDQPLAVSLPGHRWERGPNYTDVELLPPGGGATLAILSGSAEDGGGLGEWPIIGRAGGQMVMGSLVTTKGGAVALLSA